MTTQQDIQTLITILDVVRRGVHQVSGEQLVELSEVVKRYRDYVQRIVDEANAPAQEVIK